MAEDKRMIIKATIKDAISDAEDRTLEQVLKNYYQVEKLTRKHYKSVSKKNDNGTGYDLIINFAHVGHIDISVISETPGVKFTPNA